MSSRPGVSNYADSPLRPMFFRIQSSFGCVCRCTQYFLMPGVHTCYLTPDSMLLSYAGFKVGELRLFGSARSAGREVDTKFGKVRPFQSLPALILVGS